MARASLELLTVRRERLARQLEGAKEEVSEEATRSDIRTIPDGILCCCVLLKSSHSPIHGMQLIASRQRSEFMRMTEALAGRTSSVTRLGQLLDNGVIGGGGGGHDGHSDLLVALPIGRIPVAAASTALMTVGSRGMSSRTVGGRRGSGGAAMMEALVEVASGSFLPKNMVSTSELLALEVRYLIQSFGSV